MPIGKMKEKQVCFIYTDRDLSERIVIEIVFWFDRVKEKQMKSIR
jgi:hypothetical protein